MEGTPYDRIADWYDKTVRSGWGDSERFERELLPMFGLMEDLEGRKVCDLGCGQGDLTRGLARAGANVIGVDVSDRLLEIARQEEKAEPLGIEYVLDDAQRLAKLAERSFDGVLCGWSLMDIEDHNACFRAAVRILRPGGWFVFVITHPCFQAPGSRWVDGDRLVSNYFQEGFWRSDNPEGVRGKVGAYHRTLSTYVNGLVGAGLMIERLVEPQGAGPSAAGKVPGFLYVRCKRI